MKKSVLCLLALLISNSVSSQGNEWEWNEHTKDVAYEAPNSKFAKKWYSRNKNSDGYYQTLIIRPNGTCTFEGTTNNDETGFVIPIKLTFSATWKRIERLTFLVTYANMKSTVDQSVLAKIPARRRDIFKKSFAQYEVSQKKKIVGRKEKHSILKVDDDHLIMLCGGRYYYYMSERLYKRKLDENALAEKDKNNEEEVYDSAGEMPKFPGGPSAMYEYLSKNIQYPETAKMKGIHGRVIVTIIIEKDGSVSNAKVAKSVEPSLDEEALRVVTAMPKWVPGKQNGVPVRVKYTVPVTFRL